MHCMVKMWRRRRSTSRHGLKNSVDSFSEQCRSHTQDTTLPNWIKELEPDIQETDLAFLLRLLVPLTPYKDSLSATKMNFAFQLTSALQMKFPTVVPSNIPADGEGNAVLHVMSILDTVMFPSPAPAAVVPVHPPSPPVELHPQSHTYRVCSATRVRVCLPGLAVGHCCHM